MERREIKRLFQNITGIIPDGRRKDFKSFLTDFNENNTLISGNFNINNSNISKSNFNNNTNTINFPSNNNINIK